jgi:ribosomal protein L37E
MFCDKCGKEIQPGQQFCSACGKPALATTGNFQYKSKVARHVHILGILWLVYSAFTLIGACILFILSMTLFGPYGHLQNSPDVPVGFLHVLFVFLGIFVGIKAFASLAIGVGLLQKQPWARTLALVFAFIALLNIPFGMALGIYTLWVLMSPNAADEYRRLSETTTP